MSFEGNFASNLGPKWKPPIPESDEILRERVTKRNVEVLATVPGCTITTYEFNPDGEREKPPHEVLFFAPNGELMDETPIVFMPGWLGIAADYKESLATLASNTQRNVIGWNDIKGTKIGNEVRYPHETDTFTTQLEKVIAMDALLDLLHVHEADVIAHSEGCVHALILEDEHQNRFSEMVLINPAGIVNNTSMLSLIRGGMQEGLHRVRSKGTNGTPANYMATADKTFVSGSLSQKLDIAVHGIKSMWGLSRTDIRHIFEELRNEGIKISITSGEEDKLFLTTDLEHASVDEMVDLFVPVAKTDHNGFLVDPVRFSNHVIPLLTKPVRQ
jgi:pimeloyl-ACP methyl ester carboxylesterase